MTDYYAICDKCGEGRCVIVNNPVASLHYLKDESKHVQKFLEKHGQHNLRLIFSDADFQKLYADGWEDVDQTEEYKKRLERFENQADKDLIMIENKNLVRKK